MWRIEENSIKQENNLTIIKVVYKIKFVYFQPKLLRKDKKINQIIT